jgi:hypothetical protein
VDKGRLTATEASAHTLTRRLTICLTADLTASLTSTPHPLHTRGRLPRREVARRSGPAATSGAFVHSPAHRQRARVHVARTLPCDRSTNQRKEPK